MSDMESDTEKENNVSKNHSESKSSEENGLTVALYMGSALLLAGVAGLVWSGLDAIGLGLLILSALAFFAGGALMRKIKSLKIVSQVLVGISMATLPFIGVLIYNITKIEPSIIWFVMSMLGVPIYIYAANIMPNKIFPFFVIAGLVSMSCSLSSVLSLNVVWYFVFVMLTGIILNFINLSKYSSKLGPLTEAFQLSGKWLPLVTLVASTMASPYINNVGFFSLTSLAIVHLIFNIIDQWDITLETLLRFGLPIWLVLLIHIINPSIAGQGIGLSFIAIAEVIYSLLIISKKPANYLRDEKIEYAWIVGSAILLMIAGAAVVEYNEQSIWISLLVTSIVDAILLTLTRFCTKDTIWYCSYVLLGIILPISISKVAGLDTSTAPGFLISCYALVMFLLNALAWKDNTINGDALSVASATIQGLAIIATGQSVTSFMIGAILFAICAAVRGAKSKNDILKEISIYALASALIALVVDTKWEMWSTSVILVAHIIAGSLLITGLIWDDAKKPRLITSAIVLLSVVGLATIGGPLLPLFLIESIAVLFAGILSKIRPVWITGAVAIMVVVIRFTSGIPFMWPILLGIGIIVAVIFIILSRERKH